MPSVKILGGGELNGFIAACINSNYNKLAAKIQSQIVY